MEVKIAPTVRPKVDKIVMLASLKMTPISINGHYCYINEQLLKKLQAGDLPTGLAVCAIGILLFVMLLIKDVEGFAPLFRHVLNWNAPTTNNWGNYNYGRRSTSTPGLEIFRPSTMPHQEFVDLTKEERRQLPHSLDRMIRRDDSVDLQLGFWQAKHKVKDHGASHGLEYEIKSKGGTKTAKTDENTLKMMELIVEMADRANRKDGLVDRSKIYLHKNTRHRSIRSKVMFKESQIVHNLTSPKRDY